MFRLSLILLVVDLRLFACCVKFPPFWRRSRRVSRLIARFLALQIRGFVGRQRAVGHAVRDAILLVFLALVNSALRQAGGANHDSRYKKV